MPRYSLPQSRSPIRWHWPSRAYKRVARKDREVRKLIKSLDQFIIKVLLAIIVVYVVLFGWLQAGGLHLELPTLGFLVLLIPIWLIDGLKGLVESHMPSSYKTGTEDLSKVTVVVASKNSESCIRKTIADLKQRFPPTNILIASNGSTDSTVSIIREMGVGGLEMPGIGKVRAINEAMAYVHTPYVLVLDDDTLIGDALIPTSLLDSTYEAVAFRVLVNTSTWVTKMQMYEYRKSTDIGKRYHNRGASVQNISGAIGLFRKSELERQTRLHTGEFSGEDLQRTLLIHMMAENKGVVLTDSTVYTDPPTKLRELFKQRSLGWWPGMYANFTNYFRLIFKPGIPPALRIDAFYNVFLVMLMDITRLLALPALIFYPWTFALMYVTYIGLETVTYLKSGHQDPYWVVMLYPFYGLFGFIARAVAFGVFAYRRLVASIAKAIYFDDYRHASTFTKVAILLSLSLIFESILLLNNAIEYSQFVLSSIQ